MRIVVIGGNHGTGAALARRALQRGDHVTSVSRSGWDHPPAHLVDMRLDATASEQLDDVIAGADAVVVAVGAPLVGADRPRTRVTAAVIAAMRRVGVDRLVVHSSLGVGDSLRLMKQPVRTIARVVLSRALADHADQEALAERSGLVWTSVRPGGLRDEPASGRTRLVPTSAAMVGQPTGSITRDDVAAGILRALDAHLRGTYVFVPA